MAPDRGGSTAILNPVPDRGWSTAILDPIPDRGWSTAILDRGKQILASTTCMGAVKADEGGLVICIPSNKHATDNSSRTICKPIPSNWMEEETAPVVSCMEGPARTPQVQLVTNKTQKFGIPVPSTTHGDNHGVAHDSACSQAKVDHHSTTAGQHNHPYSTPRKQALSQCTDINGRRIRPRQTVFRLTDFYQLHSSPHLTDVGAKDASGTCKYVNIEQYNVKQNFPKRDEYHDEFGTRNSWRNCTEADVWYSSKASHTHLGCHTPLDKGGAPVGNLSNWLRVVKPEVECAASLSAEESWPPLLACRKKGETFGSHSKNSSTSCTNSPRMQDRIKPLFVANYEHKDVGLLSNMENRSNSYTVSPHVVPLDEQSWPSLEKSCKESVLHDDYRSEQKTRTLRPLVSSSNFHHHPGAAQDQRQRVQHSTPHGGFHKTENMCIPPLLLMLNKDFIVTSPLKENLLLTLALMGKRSDVETPESFQGQTTVGETKRQILVGQFKAFSSFLHFMLGRDATRVRTESNAGGTSTISESLSVEYFVRRFQAKDIVTEMEVEYRSFNWKKVDYICTLYGQRVGVSVTRAMSFPDPKDFSAQMGYRLLYKKLFGLVVARHGVSKRHSFSQCILHVWCETQETASIMQREYDGVSQELDIADDVVMVLTVADGCHARPIFYESLLRG